MILILMIAYRIGVDIVDFIILIFASVFLCLLSTYRLFVKPNSKSLEAEVVLITGSGHGIGRELALQFSRLGAIVICLDENEKFNNQTVAQIIDEGGDSFGFICDVSDRQQIKQVSEKVREKIGDVTILVNNAGIYPMKPFLQYTSDEIEKIFTVNVLSQFWVIILRTTIKEWLPTFMKQDRGHIVTMSSLCGTIGLPHLVPYCSSKFAVTGLTEGLLEELRYGNQHSNIKVTRVHPFVVYTGLETKSKVRFPLINRDISVEECAESIIESIRREEEVVFVPNWYYHISKLIMTLPRKVQQTLFDFMNNATDPPSIPLRFKEFFTPN